MRTAEDRFWSNVDKTGDCWLWTAYRDPCGYGRFHFEGGRAEVASRVVWQLVNGPIPEGLFVCHHCDNPPCVNPDHLFVGTPLDNVRDMIEKGRGSNPPVFRGIKHHSAKASDETVRGARESYAAGMESQVQIAARVGVAQGIVSAWLRGTLRPEAGGPFAVPRPRGGPDACHAGHEWTPENTRVQVTGRKTQRCCRACARDRYRQRVLAS